MSRKTIAVMAGACLAGALVFGTGGAASAGETAIVVKNAKAKSGPYAKQRQVSLDPGTKKNFYVKVKNNGAAQPALDIDQFPLPPSGWTVKWFKGSQDVSEEVLGDGLNFNLGAGKTKTFRVKVKRATASTVAGCIVAETTDDEGDHAETVIAVNQVVSNCD